MRAIDIPISITLLVALSIATVFSYLHLLEVEKPEDLFGRSILPGHSNESILHGTRCIGEFKTTLIDTDTKELTTEGMVRILFQGRSAPAFLKFYALFNPLGQLTDSRTSLTFGDSSLVLNSSGITPINVHITGYHEGTHFERDNTISGPVLLTKTHGGGYTLEYLPLSAQKNTFVSSLVGKILSENQLSLSQDSALACRQGTEQFDITPLVTYANTLIAPFATVNLLGGTR